MFQDGRVENPNHPAAYQTHNIIHTYRTCFKRSPTVSIRAVDGNVLDEVELIPKASATFVRARLWIDRASRLVHRLEIHQENGSVRRIWLSQIDPDPVLERGTFLFEPPPGVLVILR